MSSSPAVMGPPGMAPVAAPEHLAVPTRWRIGQLLAIGAVLALALYYNLVGWKSGAQPGAGDSRSPFDQLGFFLLAAFVWLYTPNAATIAMATLKEAARRRWMAVMLVFSVIVLCSFSSFSRIQPGEEYRFLRDFGTGFIITITLLMAIFLGVALVPPEIDRRTIFTILAKPVTRLEYILGKFAGLALTLLVNVLVMGVVFLIAYILFKGQREGWAAAWNPPANAGAGITPLGQDLTNLVWALTLHFGQLAILAALALTLSLIVSPITALIFCFIAYFGGQMSSYWEHLGQEHGEQEGGAGLSKPMQGLINIIYFMLPRLDRFDVRDRLVNDTPIMFNYVWKAWCSGLIYVAVLLTIAYLVFSDREF